MFDIEFYRLESGKSPVEDFLDSLNSKMRNKAVRSLELLEEFGNTLREPNSKAMGDGLFELRIKFSSKNKIVLTNGFVKKTQRTPPAEIELARKYRADYERRHSHE